MIHKAFEVIGKRVMIEDVLDDSRLIELKKNLEGKSEHIALNISEIRNLVKLGRKQKIGIFQESEMFDTIAEGIVKPALDFIEPTYNPNPIEEKYAKGRIPRERINPDNPILSFHLGVDHLKLKYKGRKKGEHIFEGGLSYEQGVFYNDGNFEVYDKYREPLKKAGFKIF